MHTIFSAALREFLFAANISDLATHLILGTVVGIAASLIGYWVSQYLRLSRLLGF